MSNVHLSKRLQAIADLVDGQRIADIGTDHAYIPIALAQAGQIDFAIASDVGEGPVAIAEENVREAGLTDKIEVRLADGLSGISAEDAIDTLVIAGMGGLLISRLLTEGKNHLDGTETLLLAPNRDVLLLRQYLAANEFGILDEKLVEDAGHVYPVIVAGQTKPEVPYSRADLLLGPVLRRDRSRLFLKETELARQKTMLVIQALQEAATPDTTKLQEEQADLAIIKEVLADGDGQDTH
ncbi:tRNA (adenine(22)-N(1))-methyltransferase [Lacticaseibacillus mingshuiensis]|uniref:tRNA (Adenine(22)-N(1))-methyltransferase n=1 Tax=Lacticaseibacillus mingshuiensis TaxID=2799574 RepID=A0ABW4CFJ3_9LACO|nr:class I SAM-dependent methyltransferase [Lacticaseibacillus mingshuiensis]